MPLSVYMVLQSLSSPDRVFPNARVIGEMDDYGIWKVPIVQNSILAFVSTNPLPKVLPDWVSTVMDDYAWWGEELCLESGHDGIFGKEDNSVQELTPFTAIKNYKGKKESVKDRLTAIAASLPANFPTWAFPYVHWLEIKDALLDFVGAIATDNNRKLRPNHTVPEWISSIMDKQDWWGEIHGRTLPDNFKL